MDTNIAKISDSQKIATFGSDKNLQSKITQIDDNDSLAVNMHLKLTHYVH